MRDWKHLSIPGQNPVYHFFQASLGLIIILLLSASFLFEASRAFAQEKNSESGSRLENVKQQKSQSEQELANIRRQITLSQERKNALDEEIAALDKDRIAINRSMIKTSQRSRGLEKRIERVLTRLEELRIQENGIRLSLNGRKHVLVEIIAALQKMGRNPPPALLVKPEDALSSIRSAILMGAVLPEIRAEAELLGRDLQAMSEIRAGIEKNRDRLAGDLASLNEEEARLERLMKAKRERAGLARQEIAQQAAIAAELAAKAGGLEELIRQFERESLVAERSARTAERRRRRSLGLEGIKPGELTAKPETPYAFGDPGRIAPARPFPAAKGMLPLPVNGVTLYKFGDKTEDGTLSKGLSIATRVSSRVISPADGWVIYAGPFRSYGQILILNAGSGYQLVLAGMKKIDVVPGQFVMLGEPVARMGQMRADASFDNIKYGNDSETAIGSSRPVLYIEFRKNRESIDPAPWWSDENEFAEDLAVRLN